MTADVLDLFRLVFARLNMQLTSFSKTIHPGASSAVSQHASRSDSLELHADISRRKFVSGSFPSRLTALLLTSGCFVPWNNLPAPDKVVVLYRRRYSVNLAKTLATAGHCERTQSQSSSIQTDVMLLAYSSQQHVFVKYGWQRIQPVCTCCREFLVAQNAGLMAEDSNVYPAMTQPLLFDGMH